MSMQPNIATYLTILRTCSSTKAIQYVHLQLVESGFDSVLKIATCLIDMYLKCGDLRSANMVFVRLDVKDVVIWSLLICGYVRHGLFAEAIQLFKYFQMECAWLDEVILACTLKAYGNVADLVSGRSLHSQVIEMGLEMDSNVRSALIELYAKSGDSGDLDITFLRLEREDLVLWSVCMSNLLDIGRNGDVLKLFEQMKMIGMKPDEVIFVCNLNACSRLANLFEGQQVHGQIIGCGHEVDLSIASALIDMYMKSGSPLYAQMVFQKLERQDVVTWSALTAGYVQHGLYEEALELFIHMHQQGTAPNQVTFVCILKACSSLLALDEGKSIHIQIIQSGHEGNLFVANGLIDLYGNCGSIQEAEKIFNNMMVRDVVTWNSMIAAYVRNERGSDAMHSFKNMLQAGLKPDSVSFLGALQACTDMSALHHGMHVHSSIIDAGVESDDFIISALIDMYSKCGSIEDAFIAFQRWLNPDVVIWSAMIAAYVQHSDYLHAFSCFEAMQRAGVYPNSVTFLSILSACGQLGHLNEGCFYLKLMVESGITPGLEHYNAFVCILCHAGLWSAAEDLLETISVTSNLAGWTTLLSACKAHINVVLGRRCFDTILTMDPQNAAAHAIMKNLYIAAGMQNNSDNIDASRKFRNLWKKPAKSYIEISEEIHSFMVGDTSHPDSNRIYQKLKSLNKQIQELSLDSPERALATSKDSVDCGHCEKLAVAFGLLSTPHGATIRVSKNLKMCTSCHADIRLISKIELREIIITDLYCVHQFKEGICSCESGRMP
ncbi:hypothetical protein KP509_07G026400 [Ceratopteris richardii]|nr:hypothetical protein KP509_07G026400 [Ceratopteris richardii]